MVPLSTGLPDPATTTLGERFLELTTDVAGAIDFEGRVVGANPALLRTGASPVGEPRTCPPPRSCIPTTSPPSGPYGATSSRACATRPASRSASGRRRPSAAGSS